MSRNVETGYETKCVMVESQNEFEIETESKATETETIAVVDISLEQIIKSTDKCTDLKFDTVDLSSEYCRESVVLDVSYEQVKDTVDFSGSVESKIVEVGTDTFGEKGKIYVDTLTIHEGKVKVEETMTEFKCDMIDSESSLEQKYTDDSCSHEGAKTIEVGTDTFGGKQTIYVDTLTIHEGKAKVEETMTEFKCEMIDSESSLEQKYTDGSYSHEGAKTVEIGTDTFGDKQTKYVDTLTIHEGKGKVEETMTEFKCEMIDSESSSERKYNDDGWSYEGGAKLMEVGSEFRNVMIDCSSEYTIKVNDAFVEQMQTTCEVGVETVAVTVVDEHSAFELSSCTFDCEPVEVPEEIVPQTGTFEESEVYRLEDECISSEITMCDIATTSKVTLVDMSSEKQIDHVEHISEWSKETKHDNEIFETDKIVWLSTIVTSDEDVEYRSVDIQFEGKMSRNVETGYETKCVMVESQNEFEVCHNSISFCPYFDFFTMEIGIQVNYHIPTFDFCQMFECSSSEVSITEYSLSKSSICQHEYVNQSFTEADDLEWAEVGLDLGILPIAIATQTDNFDDYILQYIQSNINTEIIRTIKEIIYKSVESKSVSCETNTDMSLFDFCLSTFGSEEISYRIRSSRAFVDEFQNTDELLKRSVYVQNSLIEFNTIGSSYSLRDVSYNDILSSTELFEFELFSEYFDKEQEISKLLSVSTKISKDQAVAETETVSAEFRSTGTQACMVKNYDSISSIAIFPINYFADSVVRETFSDDSLSEMRFIHRQNLEGNINDDSTQTIIEARSCGIQISHGTYDMQFILTDVDLLKDTLMSEIVEDRSSEQFDYIQKTRSSSEMFQKIDDETQTIMDIFRSNGSQTNLIDLSESYWTESISMLENSYAYSSLIQSRKELINTSEKLINLKSVKIQTDPIRLKEVLINSEVNEYCEISESSEVIHRIKTKPLSKSVEGFEDEIFAYDARESVDDTFELYSRVTESSQTDPFIEESESLFEQQYKTFRHIMKTVERKSNLTEIIDTSISLNVTLKSVSNPRNRNKITNIDLAIHRGWIDVKRSLYCNPSSEEKIPFEIAIRSNKIEILEPEFPNNRIFGLYMEKSITKIEKLRIKDVLNTETGDLYDEILAKDQGLLLENGSFYDKQLKKELPFEIALLHHYIEVFNETEIINYLENDKNYFKIKTVIDKERNERYDFNSAIEKQLVNIADSTFRDTENKCDCQFKEALQRNIIEVEKITSVRDLYFPHKNIDNIIERERLFSSQSCTSKSKSITSAETF